MKCPYCNTDSSFNNSNLSHKYKHSCNKYFKLCPICGTKYVLKNPLEQDGCKVVENIFDIDYCKECNRAWLPDFPTSWTRSFTNLDKIYEVIQDIFNNEQKSINADNLFNIQRSHYGVIYNPSRAKLRGIEAYIAGSGRRRMLEYFNVLKNMGILRIKNIVRGTINHEFTRFGDEIVSNNNPKHLLTCFIIAYLNIKLNNGFQRKQINSCYRYFKIRFTHNLLKTVKYVNEKGEGASKYQIGLSFLARDESQFRDYCLKYIDTYSSNMIKKLLFEDESELNRAVTSTFINVFESMGVLICENNTYYLSKLGEGLLTLSESRPALWFEDLEMHCDKTGEDINEVFAKLILWRLVINNIVEEIDINININTLDQLVENIIGIPINKIRDIHINIYYDEPMYKDTFNHTFKILNFIKDYLKEGMNISTDEIKEMCSLLMFTWYSDIYSIIENEEKDIVEGFVNSAADIFKSNMQSGRVWHEKTKQIFNELGLLTVDYKGNTLFADLTIKKLNLMLSGGTIHNPDLLILEEGYGPQNCILVDAKDQNSINAEIPKLMGYNLYSKHPCVDTYTIIPLRGQLPQITRNRIETSIEEFDRITIIEEKALEKLLSKGITRQEILNLIVPKNGYKLINIDMI